MIAFLFAAFLLGIGGSLHCMGMCGPLVLRMPFQSSSNSGLAIATYLLSKSLAYGFLGLFFGLIGRGFYLFNWQQYLSIFAGVVIILFAVYPKVQHLIPFGFLFNKIFVKNLRRIQLKPGLASFSFLGFMNGFLPCGLVYMALAGATVMLSAWKGALFMIFFGLGTIPILAIVALLNKQLSGIWKKRLLHFSFIISIAIGLLLIVRGLNLNIPYLSPYMEKARLTIDCMP